MEICLKMLGGMKLKIGGIQPSTPVAGVKTIFSPECGISPGNMIVIFRGQVLSDETAIGECVQEPATVWVISRRNLFLKRVYQPCHRIGQVKTEISQDTGISEEQIKIVNGDSNSELEDDKSFADYALIDGSVLSIEVKMPEPPRTPMKLILKPELVSPLVLAKVRGPTTSTREGLGMLSPVPVVVGESRGGIIDSSRLITRTATGKIYQDRSMLQTEEDDGIKALLGIPSPKEDRSRAEGLGTILSPAGLAFNQRTVDIAELQNPQMLALPPLHMVLVFSDQFATFLEAMGPQNEEN